MIDKISISPEVEKLGIKTVGTIFSNARISNRSAGLEDKKKEVIEKINFAMVPSLRESYN